MTEFDKGIVIVLITVTSLITYAASVDYTDKAFKASCQIQELNKK